MAALCSVVVPLSAAPADKTAAAVRSMKFVRIQPGSFQMGSEKGDANEKPVHRVKLTRAFEMQATEVTQSQWEALMGGNPSEFKGADRPVETVSWNEVQQFIGKLNARNDGYRYRLPTEGEWEYACRAGTAGDHAGKLSEVAWYLGNSGEQTHPVGLKKANDWGLHDMHGNVWEWVQDYYGAYSTQEATDPQGPQSGSARVIRGGGWGGDEALCRSSFRESLADIRRDGALGFRLVRIPR